MDTDKHRSRKGNIGDHKCSSVVKKASSCPSTKVHKGKSTIQIARQFFDK